MPHDASLPDPSRRQPGPSRGANPIAGRIDTPSPATPPSDPVIAPFPTRRAAPPPVPPALSAQPDLMTLLGSLRRRWVAAVLLGGTLAAITAVAVYWLLTPKATAFAKLSIAAEEPKIFQEAGRPSDFKTFLQTQAGAIASRVVIMAALQRDEVKRLNLASRETDPVAFIEEELKVDVKENSELLTILMSSYDPTVATAVANAIKAAYIDVIVYAQRNERGKKVTELEKAHANATDELGTRKKRLAAMIASKGVNSDPLIMMQQRLETLNALREAKQQQAQVAMKLIENRGLLKAIDTRIGTTPATSDAPLTPTGPSPEEVADNDTEIRELEKRISLLEIEYGEFVQKGGARMPTAQAIKRRLESVRQLCDERRQKVLAKARRIQAATARQGGGNSATDNPQIHKAQIQETIKELTALEGELKTEVERLTVLASNPFKPDPDYDNLVDEIRHKEKAVSDLANRLQHETIELRASPRVTSFQDAELMKKDTKKQLLATITAPIAVFGAVCMSLAWFDFRQRRVRTATQVSRGLGIRVVGAVPNMPGLERRLPVAGSDSDLEGTPVLESIDAIRTQLLHEADGGATRLVLVTSAGGGEGKTTLACHLASSLARAGRKTLLVDGDLRHPTIHQLFEVSQHPGFAEALLGEVVVPEAWQESTIENLTLMPAGQWDREVFLSLSRGGVEAVFAKLVEEFDFVIVDSHPVLTATDSLLLGRQADAVILSVLREVSQMPRVYAAAQKLQTLGIRVLGAVVNGADPDEVFTAPVGLPVGHAA
jgi:capsular exopolysaccharide synthesis family protein